jgi:hypothetical protein
MNDHKDESLIDKVKNAFGMGSDDDEHLETRHDDIGDPLSSDRPDGWAGVDESLGGAETRPAGPDYGAADTPVGVGNDAGLDTAPLGGGTTGSYTGPGEQLEPEYQGGDTARGEWTRGEAASGQSPFDEDVDTTRREQGI